MPPFHAILVGLTDPLAAQLKQEFAARGVPVEQELPTAEAVVSSFAGELPTPRLVVLHAPTREIAAAISCVRDHFPNWPIIAVLDRVDDSGVLLAVNRAGAEQIVSLPLNHADFGEALARIMSRFRPIGQAGQVLAVTGVIPGSGATTLAAALAGELASTYAIRTLLIEATLRMGVLALHLNVQPKLFLTDLLLESDKLDLDLFRKAVTPVAPRLDLVAAPPELTRTIPHPVQGMLQVINLARQVAPMVVLDLPCTFDDLQFELLWTADQIILVGEQSLPAIRTLRMILDAAQQANAVKRVHVVLNKYDPSIANLTAAQVRETLNQPEILTIPNDYSDIMQAVNEGCLLRNYAPLSPVLTGIRKLAQAVVGPPRPQPEHRHTFLSRLYEFFHPTASAT
jgi:pilus assembly protein CpaE